MDQTPSPSDESLPPQEPLNLFAKIRGVENIPSYCPPRLGIIHLLGWVTVAAVLMKFNVAMEMLKTTPSRSVSETFKLVQQIITYSGTIMMAATLVGGMVFYYDRFCRKSKGSLQPGHWLIAIHSVASVISLIIWLGMSILSRDESMNQDAFRIYIAIYGFIYLGMAIACFFAVRRLAERGRWRWVLIYMTIENGFQGIMYGYAALHRDVFMHYLNTQCCGYPLVALELVAMIIDLVKRVPRDWLHWLGVVTPLTSIAMNLAYYVLYTYLQRAGSSL